MKNILFIGCLYSDADKEKFRSQSKRGYQFAAQNFQEALLKGFLENDVRPFVVTVPALSTFPGGYRCPMVKGSDYILSGQVLGRSIGFVNLPFLNQADKKNTTSIVDNWYNNTRGKKCIVVYALLAQQMSIAVAAKQHHPDIKLCIIVPDLPRYMACNKYYKMLGLQKRAQERIDAMVPQFDGFVVLAKPMVYVLQVTDKPYTVVEGIYNKMSDDKDEQIDKYKEKSILYAGGIQTRYGVFDLIEAFTRINEDSYRLILCGPCQEMDKMNGYLQKDKRIKYLGLLPTEEARRLQRQVTLLVNPRHSNEMFTQFSFPSKTLEYMASGTPVLMCHLPSLPDEYLEHVFLFEDETIDGMAHQIKAILSRDSQELKTFGDRASQFILEEKNPKMQVKRIIDLISSVY